MRRGVLSSIFIAMCAHVLTECLEGRSSPAIAATDFVHAYADQICAFVPMRYTLLGTDGYGRSDARANLRRFFEVGRAHCHCSARSREQDECEGPGACDQGIQNRHREN